MTHKPRIIAADDEPLALRRIELLLHRMPDVELMGLARSGQEALALAAARHPDILLLDVQMADMNGLTVASRLPSQSRPLVIFVTAFDRFAVPAFDVDAVDYVVKPVAFERLRRAIDRAVSRLGRIDAALPQVPAQKLTEEIWAERRGAFVRVPLDLVEWAESERDYVRLHEPGGSYLLRGTLGQMRDRLGADDFLQIRRSTLVRKSRIVAIRRVGSRDVAIRLVSGTELRVGTTFLKQIRSLVSGRPSEAPANK